MARIEEIVIAHGLGCACANSRSQRPDGSFNLGRLGQLGQVDLPAAVYSEPARRWAIHAVGLLAVNAGGALTGYLAAGTGMGALIGANASTALWGLGQGAAGYQLTQTERLAFIATGLLSVASTGYLFLRRRKGR